MGYAAPDAPDKKYCKKSKFAHGAFKIKYIKYVKYLEIFSRTEKMLFDDEDPDNDAFLIAWAIWTISLSCILFIMGVVR